MSVVGRMVPNIRLFVVAVAAADIEAVVVAVTATLVVVDAVMAGVAVSCVVSTPEIGGVAVAAVAVVVDTGGSTVVVLAVTTERTKLVMVRCVIWRFWWWNLSLWFRSMYSKIILPKLMCDTNIFIQKDLSPRVLNQNCNLYPKYCA